MARIKKLTRFYKYRECEFLLTQVYVSNLGVERIVSGLTERMCGETDSKSIHLEKRNLCFLH